MLYLPNYKETDLEVQIMQLIARLPQTDYFITVTFPKIGENMPLLLEGFILKLIAKQTNYRAFRKAYQENDWRIILTFNPTRQPVDPRYSLTDAFVKLCRGLKE